MTFNATGLRVGARVRLAPDYVTNLPAGVVRPDVRTKIFGARGTIVGEGESGHFKVRWSHRSSDWSWMKPDMLQVMNESR